MFLVQIWNFALSSRKQVSHMFRFHIHNIWKSKKITTDNMQQDLIPDKDATKSQVLPYLALYCTVLYVVSTHIEWSSYCMQWLLFIFGNQWCSYVITKKTLKLWPLDNINLSYSGNRYAICFRKRSNWPTAQFQNICWSLFDIWLNYCGPYPFL